MFWIRQKNAVFACPIYQNYGRQILDKNYTEPLFKLQLGLKDIRLIAETANESNTPMRFTRVLQDRFSEAVAHAYPATIGPGLLLKWKQRRDYNRIIQDIY